jgi:hypothetical protein
LIALGVVFILLGVAGFGLAISGRRANTAGDRPLIGEDQGYNVTDTPRLWTIGAGLSLAAGGACVGIGMNRWQQGRSRKAR